MKIKHISLLIPLLIATLASGCVAPTKVISNKAEYYVKEPKNILLITDIGGNYGKDFTDAFQHRLTEIFNECSASLTISRISSLELDEDVHLKKIEQLKPDAILRISRNGGTKNEYGQITHTIYDLKLLDTETKKLAWRAKVDFYRGPVLSIPSSARGKSLAVSMSNKMKEDGIFRSCKVITEKEG